MGLYQTDSYKKYLFPDNSNTKRSIIDGRKNPNDQKSQQHTTEENNNY